MPSIYKKLKNSDRKFIRTEKARIRREFLDSKKQDEMISELYKKMLGEVKPEVKEEKKVKIEVNKPKKVKTKKVYPIK